jgi:hypothetical protein
VKINVLYKGKCIFFALLFILSSQFALANSWQNFSASLAENLAAVKVFLFLVILTLGLMNNNLKNNNYRILLLLEKTALLTMCGIFRPFL